MDAAAPLLVAASDFFRGLSPAACRDVTERARERRFARRAVLLRESESEPALFLLVAGRVKLGKLGSNGQEVILQLLGAGDVFGGVAALAGGPSPATVQAVEAGRALVWDRPVLRELVARYPEIAVNGVRIAAARMQEIQERFRELSTERVAQRIARTLLRLARQAGRRVEGGVLLDLPLPRRDLAEMTGTTLYTVSRTLSEWSERGLLETRRGRLLLRAPHALVAIAEDLGG